MRIFSSALAFFMLAAGCASIDDPEKARGIAADALPEAPADWVAGGNNDPIAIGWIDALGDPALSDLVTEAIANNRDLIAAAAAVDEARALARQAGAAIFSGDRRHRFRRARRRHRTPERGQLQPWRAIKLGG